jgi:hypothetical protein
MLCNLLMMLLQVLLAGSNTTGTNGENACDVNAIAGPDNLFYTNHNLLVAEDTSKHKNNFLWAYNLQTGVLQVLPLLLIFAVVIRHAAFMPSCGNGDSSNGSNSSTRVVPCRMLCQSARSGEDDGTVHIGVANLAPSDGPGRPTADVRLCLAGML